jgi:hypothetical protein
MIINKDYQQENVHRNDTIIPLTKGGTESLD